MVNWNLWNAIPNVLCLIIFGAVMIHAHYRCPSNLPKTTAIRTYNEKCYQFVYEEKYWPQARDFCWQHGGRLVKIDDENTNNFIVSSLNRLTWRNNGVWIGLHDRNDELRWEWVGKQGEREEQLNWWNWDSGHPGAFLHNQKDCVRLSRGSGWKWHETSCSLLKWHYRFICEYDMLPETTTKTTTNVAAGVLPWGQNTQPGSDNNKYDSTAAKKTTLTTERKKTTFKITTKTEAQTSSKASFTTKQSAAETELKTTHRKLTTTEKTPGGKKWQDKEDENMIEPVAAQQSKDEQNHRGSIIGGVLACFVAAVVVLVIIFFLLRRRRKKLQDDKDPTVNFSNPNYSGGSGGMNNTEPHVAIGTCNGIPRLENLERNDVSPNVYSTLDNMSGACARNVDETKGVCGTKCNVDNDEIDNLKNLKTINTDKENRELAPKQNIETYKNPNIYVPPNPSDESGYSEPNNFSGYIPMDGSRANSVDNILTSPGSTSTCSINSVGFQYDVPKSKKCAVAEYDVPKPENIYSEIPDREPLENMYETLDDIKDRLKSLETEDQV